MDQGASGAESRQVGSVRMGIGIKGGEEKGILPLLGG